MSAANLFYTEKKIIEIKIIIVDDVLIVDDTIKPHVNDFVLEFQLELKILAL
jgi:hypothetical protein